MAVFDDVIEDVASRFGLGTKAGPLMREVVQLVTGSPGGIGGFIDKLKSAGFGSQVASWHGKTDGTVLTAPQVQTALGGSVLGGIANRVGIAGGVASTAIGYLLPKVIGQLTPGGTIPSSLPSWVSGYLGQTATAQTERVAPRAVNVIHDSPRLARWLIPVLVGLGVLGLIWYLVSGHRPTEVATPATALAAPAHLALSNDSGIITLSGRVHDEATRTDIINSLKSVFGAANVKGDIAIDANAGPAPWLVNLHSALGNLKTPGVQAVFDGNSLKVGGSISDADRDGIVNSLQSVFGDRVGVRRG
ncbi:MAG: DUF937 domain-containing protein [Alphaproteobacteria bacterium]|nr:DUF937 domain-containing protein [Alphaproteobacteria bacterium]